MQNQGMKKRGFISGKLLLTGMLLLSCWNMSVISAETGFKDIEGKEWFAADVITLAADAREIIKGYPDGNFKPAEALTIDQFLTMLVRATGEKVKPSAEYWAINYLKKAKAIGILKDGDFPDFRAKITREQMAMLMIRWLELKEDLNTLDSQANSELILDFVMVGAYNDGNIPEVKKEYQRAVQKAYGLGLLTGYEDALFRPQGILSRAEAATVMTRMLNPQRRVTFQPEEMAKKLQAEKEQYYYGGKKWIDPADAGISKLERVKIDKMLTSGALDYLPYIHAIVQRNSYPDMSVDEVNTSLRYGNPEDPYQNQLADLEQLLLRRVSKVDAEKVIQFLSRKTAPNNNLEVTGIGFMLRNDEYLVIISENTDLENIAYTVMVNIVYRDAKWKALEKLYIQNAPIRR